MEKKAIVFDNSGTLLKRYRVLKNLETGEICKNANPLKIIDNKEGLFLTILQFNSACLINQDQNMNIYDFIKKYDIKYDVSFHKTDVTDEMILNILKNDKTTIKDISDGLNILFEKLKKKDLCNGSAIILDSVNNKVAFTLSSAGHFFPNTKKTIEILKNRGIEIFIASGDRSKTIQRITEIFNIERSNGFQTASPKRKKEIVQNLQLDGYKVMMVGDGINDVLAFEIADVSVLTLEQFSEVDKKLLNTTDYTIKDIIEVTYIDF